MKVLQVNCTYNQGSTGKIAYDIHVALQQKGYESIVCYGRRQLIREKNVYKTCGELYSKLNNAWSRFTGLMYGGLFFSTKKLIRIIEREKPTVVHLHCLNGHFVNIYRLISFLKKSGIRTILTLHAEFMYTANCGHSYDCEKWKTGCGKCLEFKSITRSIFFDKTQKSWKKMKKAFDSFENLTVVSVSPWLMNRAKQSPILKDKKHVVVLNGLNTEVFHIYEDALLKRQHAIASEKIVFHATPMLSDEINHIKGGYYVLKAAEKLANKGYRFFIAGDYKNLIKVPKNVTLLGRIEDQKLLAKYYSMADVTLLTSKRETFSMVCAESLACGTPVVGFKAGAPEQISIPKYSRFVEWGDVDALCKEIENCLTEHYGKKDIEQAALKVYDKKEMLEQYIRLYK